MFIPELDGSVFFTGLGGLACGVGWDLTGLCGLGCLVSMDWLV